jgi:hypothetical protein
MTPSTFLRLYNWVHSHGKDDVGDDDDHISFSPFSLTSRTGNGEGAKTKIRSTQQVTAIGVKAEAD